MTKLVRVDRENKYNISKEWYYYKVGTFVSIRTWIVQIVII